MTVKASRVEPQTCRTDASPAANAHWHHVCWNCGAEHCGAVQGSWYSCQCEVTEHERLEVITTSPHFDREFALRFHSPA